MKYKMAEKLMWSSSRTPQGVRGLKSGFIRMMLLDVHVAPRKGCVD